MTFFEDMEMETSMLEENAKQQLNQILAEKPNKIVLSNLMDRGYEYKKTVIEKKMIKGKLLYQIQRFTDKQVFHENVDIEAMTQIALSDFATVYSQMNVFGKDSQWDYKVTKKGKVLSNHHGNKDAQLKRTTNIAGGIVNLGTGINEIFKEAMSGEYYTVKDWTWATGQYFANLPDAMLHLGTLRKNDKISLLMSHFNILGDNKQEQRDYSTYKSTLRVLYDKSLLFPYTSGDHYMQAMSYLALMHNIKVVDINGR